MFLGVSVFLVNLDTVQLSGCAEAAVVDDLAVPDIHRGNRFHLFFGEGKVEDVQVFTHPLRMHRFGDGGNSPLVVPPQDDLRGALSLFLRDAHQGPVLEDVLLGLRKRPPGLRHHPIRLHHLQRFRLLIERVQLNLVDHRSDTLIQTKIDQPVRGKVADPDGAHRPLLVQPLHGAPRAVVVAERLVNQIEVEVGKAQLFERTVKGFERAVISRVLHPQFGGDEQLTARDAGLPHRLPDRLLVAVSCRRVDQAVARRQRISNTTAALLGVGNLKGAVSDHRHANPVAQRDFLQAVHRFLSTRGHFTREPSGCAAS